MSTPDNSSGGIEPILTKRLYSDSQTSTSTNEQDLSENLLNSPINDRRSRSKCDDKGYH